MKYGAWGKPQVTMKSVVIKTGKKQSERKKDLKKLKKSFPHLTLMEIEKVYNENNENIEDTTLNLSSFEVPRAFDSNSPNEKIELLEEMFEGMENSFIREVYGQCDNDISQATAFILEASTEEIEDSRPEESEFGNKSIGFVNKNALKRRTNQTFLEMLIETFPQVSKDIVEQVYDSCGNDMISAFETLMNLPRSREEFKQEKLPQNKVYENEYPSLQSVPQTKVNRQGVWAKDANNYFLDGNNLESVKKLKILVGSFPAIDDTFVKEIFFQMGDDLVASIQKLKELFPNNYREVPTEGPIFIPHPVTLAKSSSVESEEYYENDLKKEISDTKYNELIEVMQRSRILHDKLFQAASNAAASGNFIEARKMTSEGKKHQNIYKDAYLKTYKETFRRNNEKFNGEPVIDLHGLQAEEALMFLERFIKPNKKKIEVITVIIT